jgi:hypothetical protein
LRSASSSAHGPAALEHCKPVLDEGGPLAHRNLDIPAEAMKEFIDQLT